jgi:hypothetical protein
VTVGDGEGEGLGEGDGPGSGLGSGVGDVTVGTGSVVVGVVSGSVACAPAIGGLMATPTRNPATAKTIAPQANPARLCDDPIRTTTFSFRPLISSRNA